MIDVDVTGGVIQAVDVEKNEVAFGVDGWGPVAGGPTLDRRVDATVAGLTAGLRFPDAAVAIETAADDRWTTFDPWDGPFALAAGRHVVQVEAAVTGYVALTGPSTLARHASDSAIAVGFDRPTAVTVGFRSRVDRPRDRLTVLETLPGALAVVRHLSAAIDTDAPDKSYLSQRAHPPTVSIGPSLGVAPSVRWAAVPADITVSVPGRLSRSSSPRRWSTPPGRCRLHGEQRGERRGPDARRTPAARGLGAARGGHERPAAAGLTWTDSCETPAPKASSSGSWRTWTSSPSSPRSSTNSRAPSASPVTSRPTTPRSPTGCPTGTSRWSSSRRSPTSARCRTSSTA